jgi:hypothetical protein
MHDASIQHPLGGVHFTISQGKKDGDGENTLDSEQTSSGTCELILGACQACRMTPWAESLSVVFAAL